MPRRNHGRRTLLLWQSLLLILLLPPVAARAQEHPIEEVPVRGLRPSLAVFNFEDRTATSGDLGRAMAEMVVTALARSGQFTVIERQEMESILNEQGFALSGAVDAASAAQVGQVLGVRLAVFGAVTQFGEERQKAELGALGINRAVARVVADVRFVDTTTGEIVYAESFEGKETTVGLALDTESLDFSSVDRWGGTRIGKAAAECADKVARYSPDHLPTFPWEGTVLTVSEDGFYCYIKPGADGGLVPGNMLWVIRKGRELIDPDLGISLGHEEQVLGRIQVLDPSIGQGKAARCLILEGSGMLRGDLVKPAAAPPPPPR
jgi:curli biogenesis system outer membrane secretion channel CsgG